MITTCERCGVQMRVEHTERCPLCSREGLCSPCVSEHTCEGDEDDVAFTYNDVDEDDDEEEISEEED